MVSFSISRKTWLCSHHDQWQDLLVVIVKLVPAVKISLYPPLSVTQQETSRHKVQSDRKSENQQSISALNLPVSFFPVLIHIHEPRWHKCLSHTHLNRSTGNTCVTGSRYKERFRNFAEWCILCKPLNWQERKKRYQKLLCTRWFDWLNWLPTWT